MSSFTLRLPGLAIGPKFKMKNGQLRSRSNLVLLLLTLGLYFKHIVVDPTAKVVRIRRRILWFLTLKRDVLFGSIQRIDYSYRAMATSGPFSEVEDVLDIFTLSLVLHDNPKWVKLWSFIGEGGCETYYHDYCAHEHVMDFEGSQGQDSLCFLELLQYFTGKPLTRYG